MLEAYNAQVAERAALGIPALPLTKDQLLNTLYAKYKLLLSLLRLYMF